MAANADSYDEPRARSAAEPIVFAGTVGLFQAAKTAPRDIAVLFVSAWGLEEMCSHRFLRVLSEKLAEQGVASLRFDYPGTGDALEDRRGDEGLKSWSDCLTAAAHLLQRRSGCARIVIVAQGLGAIVASRAAETIVGLEAMVFLAPVVSGRSHVRELSALFTVANDKLRMKPGADAAEISAVSLPPAIAADLKTIDLMKLAAALASRAIVFARADRPSDSAFAGHLGELGAAVDHAVFEGYDRLTVNPLLAAVPDAVVAQVTEWVAALAPIVRHPAPSDTPLAAPLSASTAAPSAATTAASLAAPPAISSTTSPGAPSATPVSSSHVGQGYAETPVRFGREKRLYGVACAPEGKSPASMPQVVLLAAGYERQSGWGSAAARMARALALRGIPSLRFDCSNVADSPPVDGHEGQVLYTDIQRADVQEAVDFLTRQSAAPVILAGLCSGAFLAFQTAVRDPRIAGIVGVNPEVFVWPQNRSVDEALRGQVQTLEHYGKRLLQMESLKKALRGDVNVLRKSWEVGTRLKQHVVRPLSKALGGLSARERAVYAGFETLRRRHMPVSLLYSVGDIGLEEFAHFFGEDLDRPNGLENLSVDLVPEANHTFMQSHARQRYADAIVALAQRIGAGPAK